MKICALQPSDLDEVQELFQKTIVTVNRSDYSEEQTKRWSEQTKWKENLLHHHSYVAVDEAQIIGFATLSHNGSIEMLYVHHAFQGQKVASKLLDVLEKIAHELDLEELVTEASITAKPFFEKKGFFVEEEQVKWIQDTPFTNYRMLKKLNH
ncbi:GNAT family N-acetyltransferase [Pseudalkalibacillus sp. Hm43]|uniref:GNAT family N-acetyltransferase n=1 Tax=Pseudalkalibacillus sp. Hm43 TaxID=3450742 RepID=UPI003F42A931